MWSHKFFWVAWNTFLAVIPVVLALIIYKLNAVSKGRVYIKLAILPLFIAWLTFMPNTCYLLTEWRHFLDTVGYSRLHVSWQRDAGSAVTMMMYAFFYLCYSGIGIITFALGTRPIHRILRERGANMWIWAMPFFLLMSTGVYLGLILRFNTWDLLDQAGEIWQVVMSVKERPVLASFVAAFAGFLWLLYVSTDIWIDGLLLRLRGQRPEDCR